MASIAVPGQSGTIIPLEVVPATDGSGTYVLVVSLQDANIDVGEVEVSTVYHLNSPTLNDGNTAPLQSDIFGNLKVNIAASGSDVVLGAVSLSSPLPAGTNNIGGVSLTSPLPAGTNDIGGVFPAPTSSANFALFPGSSSAWETSHVLKAGAGNLYELNVIAGPADGFLMTFDATEVPPDGSVTPVDCVPVPAHGFAAIRSPGLPPDHYSNGIIAVFSTTGPFTKTTVGVYGNGPYGSGPYGKNPTTAFFKWCVQ